MTRVLVPMDDSELAERALEFALDRYPDSEITVLHVVGEPSPMMGEIVSIALEDDIAEAGREESSEIFDRAREIATEHDTEIDTVVGYGSPAKDIVSRAEEFDTVVIGSHGGSLTDRLFVGNVARTVFRRSPVPVTTVR